MAAVANSRRGTSGLQLGMISLQYADAFIGFVEGPHSYSASMRSISHHRFGNRLMMEVRWHALVVGAALVVVAGCGSGTSSEKAYDHFVAAAQAVEAGDKETALSELSASIEKSPSAWAYFQRARIYVDQGKEAEATADIQKGLEIDPKNRDLMWLGAELKKPAAQRFKGKFANPPSTAVRR
jgi:tetratricopeptide (TPR) repeat protein